MTGSTIRKARFLALLVVVGAIGSTATRWAVAYCSGGNPYCWVPSTVPCNGASCIPWSQFPEPDRPSPTPQCGIGTTVSYVSINPVSGWTTCAVSGDDTASCACSTQPCASVFYFEDDECDYLCLSSPGGSTIARQQGGGSDPCS
ncbi:hypothetical protein [Tautonia marina]|uniref:hypothetical protein n=1 Tax=Tautonia marina TaxID=2653855 RepID=UPI001260BFD3|nr:hypothetical protein [Tautonia marina]